MIFSKDELDISKDVKKKSKAKGVVVEVSANIASIDDNNLSMSGMYRIPLNLSKEVMNKILKQCGPEVEGAMLHDLKEEY